MYKLRIVYDLDKNSLRNSFLMRFLKLKIFSWWKIILTIILSNLKIEKEFERMKTKAKTEEIIVVKNNHITDTSYTNILFERQKNGLRRLLIC